MKRKSLTMILCLLTCLSLVGVGFASWVISSSDEQVVNGNIVVDTVTDNRIELSVVASAETGQNIKFLGPSDTETTADWLTSTNTEKAVLEVVYNCTISKKTGQFENTDEVKTNAEFDDSELGSNYANAIEKNCFAKANDDGFVKGIKTSKLTLTDDGKITFTVTIKYVWGTAFGGLNPFDYYNSKEISDPAKDNEEKDILVLPEIKGAAGEQNILNQVNNPTYGDHANYYLTLLSLVETKTKYNLTITATPVAPATQG